jgi:hypothetical protein
MTAWSRFRSRVCTNLTDNPNPGPSDHFVS